MKIKSIKKVKLDQPMIMYDIINATPNNNFLIKLNSNSNSEYNSNSINHINFNNKNYIISHNCGFLDEVDFSTGNSQIEGLSKMMSLYLTIKRRIESRYMKMGTVPGLMFLVSSKRSVNDFLESYINDNKNNNEVLISDEPIWKVKNTPGRYSGKTFKVAVGTRILPSKIIDEATKEELKSISDNGLRIIDVPVEHRKAFELDINSALRDIAGVALSSDIKYIDMTKYAQSVREYLVNPFTSNIITLDFDDEVDLKDFLIEEYLENHDKSKPYAIHWDASKSGDRTGLAMSSLQSNTKIDRVIGGESYSDYDRLYKLEFAIGINPTPGKEIPFYKIRNFIYYLKYDLGFNIVSVSADSFQSTDTLQQFKLKGMNSQLVSVDRSMDPYTVLKNSISEGRLLMPQIDELELELADIYYDSDRDKVDHTVTGSKDIADAVAGSVFVLSKYKLSGNDLNSPDTLIEVNKSIDNNSIDNWLFGGGQVKYYD